MVITRVLLVILAAMVSIPSGAKDRLGFYDERERGWYWYEDPPADPADEPPVPAAPLPAVVIESHAAKTPTERIAAQRAVFDNALAAAVMEPTTENIRNYLVITQQINEQAARFSDAFKKSIWQSPEYDYSLTGRPTTTQAIVAYNEQRGAEDYRDLTHIAQDKGLLYFFRSDCPFCARFSPILKKIRRAIWLYHHTDNSGR